MQLLAATVKGNARQVQTKYGLRVVADLVLSDGTESAVWGPPSYAPLADLQQGDEVTVCKDSKGKCSVVENHLIYPDMTAPPLPSQTKPQSQPQPQGLAPDTKRAIADYVTEQAKLFGFCVSQASTIPGLQAEDIRPVATTLYLGTVKKFGLN